MTPKALRSWEMGLKGLRRYCPVGFVLAAFIVAVSSGCRPSDRARWEAFWGSDQEGAPTVLDNPYSTTPATTQAVPPTLEGLLPKKIRIHPFTGTRTFGEKGNITGLDVRIEALDPYGDTTKAFGDFRFELHSFMPNSTERKASKLVTWEVPLTDPKDNFVHWNSINRAYEFKLQWAAGITAGQRYVLVAVFTSPYTKRLFAERIFIAGQ